MEVPEYFLVAGVDYVLVFFGFFLVPFFNNFFLGLVLDDTLLVDFMHEDVAPDEGEGYGDNQCDNCRPDEHCRACLVLRRYNSSDEDALDGPLGEYNR